MMPEVVAMKMDEMSDDNKARMEALFTIANSINSYAWAIFRWKNIDNEFGIADTLSHDSAKERIILKRKNIMKTLGNFLKKNFPKDKLKYRKTLMKPPF